MIHTPSDRLSRAARRGALERLLTLVHEAAELGGCLLLEGEQVLTPVRRVRFSDLFVRRQRKDGSESDDGLQKILVAQIAHGTLGSIRIVVAAPDARPEEDEAGVALRELLVGEETEVLQQSKPLGQREQ